MEPLKIQDVSNFDISYIRHIWHQRLSKRLGSKLIRCFSYTDEVTVDSQAVPRPSLVPFSLMCRSEDNNLSSRAIWQSTAATVLSDGEDDVRGTSLAYCQVGSRLSRSLRGIKIPSVSTSRRRCILAHISHCTAELAEGYSAWIRAGARPRKADSTLVHSLRALCSGLDCTLLQLLWQASTALKMARSCLNAESVSQFARLAKSKERQSREGYGIFP